MTSHTIRAIKQYSINYRIGDSLVALMDYYNVTNLACITEEMGLIFLKKLQEGEIKIPHIQLTINDLDIGQGDD